jgi:hypothetical protein
MSSIINRSNNQMPDFSTFTSRPAGTAPKPKTLVVGNYPGIIKNYELVPAPAGKDYQLIVRVNVGLLDWPAEGISDDDKLQDNGTGGKEPVNLSKKQFRKDYFFKESDASSLHRLDELIRSCGIEPSGRSYLEVLPDLQGAHVTVALGQYLNQNTNEPANQVNDLKGAA